jgi:exodeoxyribonuclease-5
MPPDAPLSPDQTTAWAAVGDLLGAAGIHLDGAAPATADPDRPPKVLAITGKAGSGKSMLLARLTGAMLGAGVRIVSPDWEGKRKSDRRTLAVLAPTNKAAAVLRAKGVPATTIHRILYTPVYDPEFERVAEWLSGSGDRPAPGTLTDAQLDRAKASFEAHTRPRRRWPPRACGGRTSSPAGSGARSRWTWASWTSLDARRAQRRPQEIFPTLFFRRPAQLPPVRTRAPRGHGLREAPPSAVDPDPAFHRQEADPHPRPRPRAADPSLEFDAFEDMVREAARRDARGTGAWTATSMARSPGARCGATPRGSSSSTPRTALRRPRPSSCPASP